MSESNFVKFTAENCEKEPIHIPGAIQPHGLLIALRASDFTILQISSNIFDHLGIHPVELVNQPLSQLMEIRPVEEAAKKLGERMPRLLNPIPIKIAIHNRTHKYDGILHRSGRVIILELERHVPAEEGYGGFGGFYEAIREVATKLMHSQSLDEALNAACEETKRLTEFSRVLIYKFDEDWNGTVVAESKDSHVQSLLHHRFPSTDIPKQARDLYLVNWLRIIPDVNYQPSALVPQYNPITDRPLDLSNSVLRSVSPVHLEYMRNMGQAASMSISLIRDKKLWGLISCHNEKPRFLKFETRVAAEFIGQMLSAQISARDETNDFSHSAHLRNIFSSLLGITHGLDGAFVALKNHAAQIIGLAEARGLSITSPEGTFCFGSTPKLDEIKVLQKILHQKKERLFYTHEVAQLGKFSEEFISKAAGILSVMVHPGYELIWFKPELTEQIPWSGNPNLSKEKSEDGTLRPRKSFETWLESVAGRSSRWRQSEIDAVTMLLEGLHRLSIESDFSEQDVRNASAFRTALAKSIEDTQDTQDSREPSKSDVTMPQTILDAATSSRALLDGFSEFSVLFLNTQGEIQNWTAGATRLLGFNADQTLGRKLDIFLSDDEIAKDKHQRIISYVASHNRCEEEMWLYRADGTSFWGKIMVAAVRDEAARLIGYSIVIQDITKEKAAEEELKAMKVSAESANQAKTAFLANISHEIRTPLGAVLGFAELLAADTLAKEERENLITRIQKNGEQLSNLINDLLDLTKVEANKLSVELIEFDLSSLLLDIQETLMIKAAEKSVNLKFAINGLVPKYIVSDPTRLRQVLVNIINNAIKFTPQGGFVTVTTCFNSKGRQNRVVISVEDTGRGMDEDQMAKLFQPFVQADVSTTRKFGGTGLGLYVSQRLARLLGGDVSIVESKLNQGSTFQITIDPGHPEKKINFQSIQSYEPSIPMNKLDNNSLKGVNILLVDDSPDNRHLMTLFLKKAGAAITTAENGLEGVDLAMSGRYDIVLMDIQMPVLDGNDAMRELAKRGFEKPVVALTAHAMSEERENSLRLGFQSYLTKPIQRDLLIHTIDELVDRP